jgi:hypothetical protein
MLNTEGEPFYGPPLLFCFWGQVVRKSGLTLFAAVLAICEAFWSLNHFRKSFVELDVP